MSVPTSLDSFGIPISLTNDVSYGTRAHVYKKLNVTSSAQTIQALISGVVPIWAQLAMIVPENGDIRYRCDGTPPAADTGMPIYQYQPWPVQSYDSINALQIISQSGMVTVSIEFRG